MRDGLLLCPVINRPAPWEAELTAAVSPFSFHTKPNCSHRTWNNTQYSLSRRCGTLPMCNDHFIPFPCSFHAKLWWFSARLEGFAQLLADLIMDDMMTGWSILTCKVHCHPVFYSFFFIQSQPGMLLVSPGNRLFASSDLCIVVIHLPQCPGASNETIVPGKTPAHA